MSTVNEFFAARIEVVKAQILAYEAAVDALAAGGVESYTLDTGQGRQQVTKQDISMMTKNIDILYNRLATLDARVNGTGVKHYSRS